MYARFVMNIIVRNAPQHTTNSAKLTIIVVSIVKRHGDGKMYDKLKSYYYNATNSNAGEEQKDLTEILK